MMIKNKEKFIENLTEEQLKAGYIKFNIPDEDNINSPNGEGVWGWIAEEDREKYADNSYYGKVVAILLNNPLNYMKILKYGDEVLLQCHGENRPTLDPEWVKEVLLVKRR